MEQKVTTGRFLQPVDMGSGWTSVQEVKGHGDWTIEFSFSAMSCVKSAWGANLPDNMQVRSLSKGDEHYLQWVALYPKNKGGSYLGAVRAHVRDCAPTVQIHQEIPGLLSDPGAGRMCGPGAWVLRV